MIRTTATGPALRRRLFLGGAGGAALLLAGPRARAQTGPERLAYVGSYTPEGKGITLWRVNTGNGAMTLVSTFETENPSWIALDPQGRVLYAVNENDPEGGVTAFAVDRSSGALTKINSVSSHGKWPCHLSVHPSGKFAFAANYGTGTVAVFPLQPNGALGEASDVVGDPGPPPSRRSRPSRAPRRGTSCSTRTAASSTTSRNRTAW